MTVDLTRDAARFKDCLDTLDNAEVCRDLEGRSRKTKLSTMRSGDSGEAIGHRALVIKSATLFEGVRLPGGWATTGHKGIKKHSLNRFAIVWKRGESYRVQLIYHAMAYIPTTGRLSYSSAAAAVQVAETFLNDSERGEFMPLAEGREIREKSGGVTMRKNPTPGLRKMIRRSVGIGRGPKPVARTPILKRPVTRPVTRIISDVDKREIDESIESMVAQALAPLLAQIKKIGAHVTALENVSVVATTPTPTDYSMLTRLTREGVLAKRVRPRSRTQAPPVPEMVLRRIPGSGCASTGKPQYAQTIRSAVRRSLCMSGTGRRRDTRGHSVKNAIAISGAQINRAIANVQKYPVGSRIMGGYRSRITGGSFPTREARDHFDEASDVTKNRFIPLDEIKS